MNAIWYILTAAGGFLAGAMLLVWRELGREQELAALRKQAGSVEHAAKEAEAMRDRAVRAETELALLQRQSAAVLDDKLSAQARIHAGEVANLELRLKSMAEAREAREREYREARDEAEKQWKTRIDLLKEEFKTISAKILDERSGTLQELNNKQLDTLLSPLRERMGEFKKAVEDAKLKNVELSADLKAQIAKVMETTRKVGSEADNLATALKGSNKTQGNWGEMILETLLENSGLQRGVHYEVQSTLCGADGKVIKNEDARMMRPDVIVHYPGDHDVIIDSKVSLNAYTDYVNSEDEAVREQCLARHLKSVQTHVDELAKKNYAEYVKGRSLDFVIMFIPNEAPHQLAMTADPGLWRRAFERRVLIVSPVNLMALLQIISVAWRRDAQERNQAEILKTAGMLLDRLYAFYETFDEVGGKLADAEKAYNKAIGQLKGGEGRHSIVGPGEKLRKLGVKMKKEQKLPDSIDRVDEAELPLGEGDPALPDSGTTDPA